MKDRKKIVGINMNKVDVLEDFKMVYDEFYAAIITQDKDRILSWYQYFIKYFPPVVYDMAPSLLNSLKGEENLITILRELYFYCPEIVYSVASQETSLYEGVYGVSIKVEDPYKSNTVVLYSYKFSENFVSSQESYKPTLEAICAKYNVIIMSPSSSPASSDYQKIGEYLEISSSETELENILHKLDKYKPRILMEFHPLDIPLSLKMDRTYTMLPTGFPVAETMSTYRRAPDFAMNSPVLKRMKQPGSKTQFGDEVFPYLMPLHNKKIRNYSIINQKKFSPKEIHFAAFGRLAKCDLTTLNMWACALRYFPSSKLYFAYIQTNKISEHYTKKYFETLSIDSSRIVFFPRLNTNDYLHELSKMDVAFGPSLEQGGVSCTDALAVGVPYLVLEINSVTTVASHLLKLIGKPEWSVKSTSDFIHTIEKILSNHEKVNNFFTRSKLQADVFSKMGNNRDDFNETLFKMIDKALC